MSGSRLLLPFPKCRRHECKFRKRAELNSAAAAVFGNLGSLSASFADFLSADLAGFLSASLAGSFEPAAAASAPSGNSVRNCIEFCNLS